MKKINYKISQYVTVGLVIIFGVLLSSPAQAEEATTTPETTTPTTTTEIATSTPEETTTTTAEISTSTLATSTTTLDITATSTLETTTTTNQIIPTSTITEAVQKILNYLKSQQSADGKIIDGNMTDWAIMSYGADNQYADTIKNATSSLLDYEKNYNLDDPSDLNSCASYPRHILALLAAGVSVNDAATQGLKNKMLTVCYQNNLYGLHGINDDVFGLIALLALGTNPSEPIIQDIVSTTKSWQVDSGAFAWPDWNPSSTDKIAGDDITGAAINALKYGQSKGLEINNEIFTKAKNYLKSTQQTDGGWGYGTSDIMTTSWVLMGVNGLGESQNEWFNSVGKNPWHPLINQLKDGGYYESAWVPGTTDWFAMKHVVPALAGKFWPIILPEKITNFEVSSNITYSSGGGYTPQPVITPSTTPTSTLPEIITPTTTLATTTVSASATEIIATTTEKMIETSVNKISIQPKPVAKPVRTAARPPIITTAKPPTTTVELTNPIQEVRGEKIVAEKPAESTKNDIAKKVLAVSGGGALAIGVYFGLRFLKNLI